ncbi:MAG: hypothetical protein WDM85_18305 [Caulobacteraceae bacterium]
MADGDPLAAASPRRLSRGGRGGLYAAAALALLPAGAAHAGALAHAARRDPGDPEGRAPDLQRRL